ncbi:Calx-beta domain-containing protein [Roseateles cellulosilyticus]|uniref:Calx-beta domain-containing protein n=1 Tax=Pelomonas cellulosilytica TaxID=2906762 RepID=A0ABS8XP80_9BURK|nr:Calx-beta domain-containing protein [Pelomonas sp. P8]MCE4553643.1 hypothetical protein [Pelomonas sp. P8]
MSISLPGALWARRLLAALAGALLLPAAWAQQHIVIENLATLEGPAGERVIELPIGYTDGIAAGAVDFDRTARARQTIRLRARTIVAEGADFAPATAGSSCTAGVDYIAFAGRDITIPQGTPWGAVKVPVTVCGDARVEATEHLFVALECLSGALCTERSVGIVTLRNDDGPPAVSVGDISLSEPSSGTREATFTLRLSHPAPVEASLRYQTEDGSAVAFACRTTGTLVLCSGDYHARSGTLTLPVGATEATITVRVLADRVREEDERFRLRLSAPVNATLSRALALATVRDLTLEPLVGSFLLSADGPSPAPSPQARTLNLEWAPPAGLSASSLRTLDLRLQGLGGGGEFLRWHRDGNRWAACRHSHGTPGADSTRRLTRLDAVCRPAPELAAARVRQADGRLLVTLPLPAAAKPAGYAVDIGTADDFGNETALVHAGEFTP